MIEGKSYFLKAHLYVFIHERGWGIGQMAILGVWFFVLFCFCFLIQGLSLAGIPKVEEIGWTVNPSGLSIFDSRVLRLQACHHA